MHRCEVETGAGPLELLYTERGVAALSLPSRPRQGGGRKPLRQRFVEPFVEELSAALASYFRGEAVLFRVPLDLRGVSCFDRRVLAVLQSIPYGETRTYGWVARQVGMPGAARAVGGACGRNPCPVIIPCHRVIAAGGGCGGYASGLHWKRYLLSLEKNKKKV